MEVIPLYLGEMLAGGAPAAASVPVHGFVVLHPSMGVLLVDTGMGDPNRGLLTDWRIVNRGVADALARHGLHPSDVTAVINTHLHWDHCGQNAVFPHAPFIVQRIELERARREESATASWFDFAGASFELVDGAAEIATDLHVIPTPGHTTGHQVVRLGGEHRPAFVMGDAAYTPRVFERYESIDLEKLPGQATDPVAWRHSLRRIHDAAPSSLLFCHEAANTDEHARNAVRAELIN
jgi:N-acyl homoserine lactone hydrolase